MESVPRHPHLAPGSGRDEVQAGYAFENFTSLSTDESVARQFAAVTAGNVAADRTSAVFKVRLKAWTSAGSRAPDEKELIQPSECTITSIEDDAGEHAEGNPPATAWKFVELTAKVGKPGAQGVSLPWSGRSGRSDRP